MTNSERIFIAGHNGMVGSSIMCALIEKGYTNIITASRQELDQRDSAKVDSFFSDRTPDYVFLAAARVGGIGANRSHPADFLYDNLMIQNNLIHQSYKSGVKKLIFLGSFCIYPIGRRVPRVYPWVNASRSEAKAYRRSRSSEACTPLKCHGLARGYLRECPQPMKVCLSGPL